MGRYTVIRNEEASEDLKKVGLRIIEMYKENGLTVEEVDFDDGYFLFDTGYNSVMHFKIKEAPNWLFGVWLYKLQEKKPYRVDSKGDYISVSIFAQNELWIDKFKPSASSYSEETKIYYKSEKNNKGRIIKVLDELTVDHKGNLDLDKYKIIDPFKFIWTEPNLAFYAHMNFIDYNQEHVTRKEADEFMKNFLAKEKYDRKFDKKSDKIFTRFFEKYSRKNKLLKLEIIDQKSEFLKVSPRYSVVFHITPEDFLFKSERIMSEVNRSINKIERKRNKKYKYGYIFSNFPSSPDLFVDNKMMRFVIPYGEFKHLKRKITTDEARELIKSLEDRYVNREQK